MQEMALSSGSILSTEQAFYLFKKIRYFHLEKKVKEK
jgi:hypothetical protein